MLKIAHSQGSTTNSSAKKKFSSGKIFDKLSENQFRGFSARMQVLQNIYRLAPDRFITVFGLFYAIALVIVKYAKPMAKSLVDWVVVV